MSQDLIETIGQIVRQGTEIYQNLNPYLIGRFSIIILIYGSRFFMELKKV